MNLGDFSHSETSAKLYRLDIRFLIKLEGESQNGGNKMEVTRIPSTPNFPKNERFLSPHGVKNVRFSENLACFVFLLPPF